MGEKSQQTSTSFLLPTARVEILLYPVKLDSESPNHSICCVLAQLLKRAQVSPFAISPWLKIQSCGSVSCRKWRGFPCACFSHFVKKT
uniref:Macaca fascicularis brain cDNA clone: QflA-16565, similar to human hypothetical protein LOC146443 (LOC146443), mRNA, RefSeq: XM_378558.1 n=1 Tax=Macaca fascicularis TaxID=9541 RepID=I7G536_MACFA|nr:unnamed protein product [Macaca fascicularis]